MPTTFLLLEFNLALTAHLYLDIPIVVLCVELLLIIYVVLSRGKLQLINPFVFNTLLIAKPSYIDMSFIAIILRVLLYGCEAWSLTLREECRLRVFENRILRRKFGSKKDKNGKWRRLHNEECGHLMKSR